MPSNDTHFSGEGHLIEAEIEGDLNKTIRSVVCDTQGHLIVDLSSGSVVIGTVKIEDTNGNPITSAGGILNVQFQAPQAVTEANVDKNFGTWSYYAGLSGTVVVAGGQRILGMAAHATNAATVTINGGPVITIPPGVSWELEPLANLVAPTVIFTGTDTYMIEVVS